MTQEQVACNAPQNALNCKKEHLKYISCRRECNGAKSVFAADLDGDGDMDLASAFTANNFYDVVDNKIAWYENTDGKGTFGSQQIVSTSADGAASIVYLRLTWTEMETWTWQVLLPGDNKIAWYENTDGKGTFGSQQIVSTSAAHAESVFAADLDGDGDMDLASASSGDNKIAWYENTDGKGTFGSQQIVSTSADGAYSVFAADLDGDGDMDLASASEIMTIKLHGTKTRTAKALLKSTDRVDDADGAIVYLRLTWTEMETWTWQVLLRVTIKLHGTKTRTAKALLEVNRSCRRVRMVLKVYLRLTWTEMETWTWQVLLSMTIKLHGTKTRTAKALLEVNRSCRRVRMVLIVYLRLTWTEMETWTWQVLLMVTIKLHGTKTRTAKALLEVNRSCRRVRMVLIVYLRLTWTEMETWTWQVLLLMTIKLHGTKTRTAKALLEVNRSCRRVRMVL